MADVRPIVIAHISDLHCGSSYFIPSLAMRVIDELNEMHPDIVVVTGDLTDMGFSAEYKTARNLIDQIACERKVVLPGNHDSRNVGDIHFEELFGARRSELAYDGVRLLALDSSEPDLDEGRVGREGHRRVEERFTDPEEIRVVAMHHHLIPVPGTGRERNIVSDSGDFLKVLATTGVDLVLCGHKHVPNVWRLEDLLIVNAGTACTTRVRGRVKPCYNVVEITPASVKVTLRQPFGGAEVVADMRREKGRSCPWRPAQELAEGIVEEGAGE
jgi:Icc protein